MKIQDETSMRTTSRFGGFDMDGNSQKRSNSVDHFGKHNETETQEMDYTFFKPKEENILKRSIKGSP
jgi:hypothetical protein